MKKSLQLVVHGKVQGVSYRYFAKKCAEDLQLHGYAKNEEDGTVTIVVEGQENALKEFLACCNDGPQYARVENISEEWSDECGVFTQFDIY